MRGRGCLLTLQTRPEIAEALSKSQVFHHTIKYVFNGSSLGMGMHAKWHDSERFETGVCTRGWHGPMVSVEVALQKSENRVSTCGMPECFVVWWTDCFFHFFMSCCHVAMFSRCHVSCFFLRAIS